MTTTPTTNILTLFFIEYTAGYEREPFGTDRDGALARLHELNLGVQADPGFITGTYKMVERDTDGKNVHPPYDIYDGSGDGFGPEADETPANEDGLDPEEYEGESPEEGTGADTDATGWYVGCTLVSWNGNELEVSDGDGTWIACTLDDNGISWLNYAGADMHVKDPAEVDDGLNGVTNYVIEFFKSQGGVVVEEQETEGPVTEVTNYEAQEQAAASILAALQQPPGYIEVPMDGRSMRTTAAGSLSDIAAARIEDADKRLYRIGLVRPSKNFSTVDSKGKVTTQVKTEGGYTPGTAALDEAYDRLATSRRLWEQRPLIEEGVNDLYNVIMAEDRKDFTIETKSISMDSDGTLVFGAADGHIRLGMEIAGFEALLPRINGFACVGVSPRVKNQSPIFPSARDFLLSMPADERAWCFNRAISRSEGKLKLRTRLNRDGVRSLFAVVSPTYAVFDADKVTGLLYDALAGKGLRGEVTYEASSTNLMVDATYHADASMQDFAAGDLFQVGYRGRSNDTGNGGIQIGGIADWNACLNFIILSHAEASIAARVHKGDPSKVAEDLVKGVAGMQPVFADFAREWGLLSEESVVSAELWGQTFTSVDDALTYAVKNGKLDMAQAKDASIELLLRAHHEGGGIESLRGIVDAITRAAHMKLIADCERDRIERQAGALVPVLLKGAGLLAA